MKNKILTEEIYNELVKNSILQNLTLEEVIDTAINYDRFWDFAGIYFRIIEEGSLSTIIIDREQSVGGYNNSELQLVVFQDRLFSNEPNFASTIYEEIEKKQQNIEDNDEESFC